jgi:hypothetical protein
LQNRYAKDLHLLKITVYRISHTPNRNPNSMAGPKGSKYYDIFLKQQLQFVTKENDIVLNEEGT